MNAVKRLWHYLVKPVPIRVLLEEELYAARRLLLESERTTEDHVAHLKMLRDRVRRLEADQPWLPKLTAEVDRAKKS